MQACSLLLGRPWEHDNDATHHGRSNKYTFVHKGKKYTLLPLTPAENVQAEKEQAASLNDTQSENQQVAKYVFPPKKGKPAPTSKAEGIKLKGGVMLEQNVTLLKFLKKKSAMPCFANKPCFHLMILLARYLLLSLTFCRSTRMFFQLRYHRGCHL